MRTVFFAVLSPFLAACGPSVWDEVDERDEAEVELEYLDGVEADEDMWIPPEHRGEEGGDDGGSADEPFDAQSAGETYQDFVESYTELFCALILECEYGMTEGQCLDYLDDYWESSCEDYSEEWGVECLGTLHAGGCEGLADGSADWSCQPVADSCSSGAP